MILKSGADCECMSVYFQVFLTPLQLHFGTVLFIGVSKNLDQVQTVTITFEHCTFHSRDFQEFKSGADCGLS